MLALAHHRCRFSGFVTHHVMDDHRVLQIGKCAALPVLIIDLQGGEADVLGMHGVVQRRCLLATSGLRHGQVTIE